MSRRESTCDAHLVSADGTGVFPYEPLVDAVGMELMVAEEFFEGLLVVELDEANRAPKLQKGYWLEPSFSLLYFRMGIELISCSVIPGFSSFSSS